MPFVQGFRNRHGWLLVLNAKQHAKTNLHCTAFIFDTANSLSCCSHIVHSVLPYTPIPRHPWQRHHHDESAVSKLSHPPATKGQIHIYQSLAAQRRYYIKSCVLANGSILVSTKGSECLERKMVPSLEHFLFFPLCLSMAEKLCICYVRCHQSMFEQRRARSTVWAGCSIDTL